MLWIRLLSLPLWFQGNYLASVTPHFHYFSYYVLLFLLISTQLFGYNNSNSCHKSFLVDYVNSSESLKISGITMKTKEVWAITIFSHSYHIHIHAGRKALWSFRFERYLQVFSWLDFGSLLRVFIETSMIKHSSLVDKVPKVDGDYWSTMEFWSRWYKSTHCQEVILKLASESSLIMVYWCYKFITFFMMVSDAN